MAEGIAVFWRGVALLAALIVIASCAPAYDETTDKQIATVQQETDTLITKLISLDSKIAGLKELRDPASQKALAEARSKATYDANIDAYDKIDTDLTSLQLRMTATPDLSAAKLGQSFRALRDNVNDLRRTHSQQGFVSAAALGPVRTALNQQFQTLMHYELNLKSGRTAA